MSDISTTKRCTAFTREQQDALSERIWAANLMADFYAKYAEKASTESTVLSTSLR